MQEPIRIKSILAGAVIVTLLIVGTITVIGWFC